MSKSARKPTAKKMESAPRYKIGNKVYYIFYPGTGPSEILECEVLSRRTTEFPEKDGLGKTVGYTSLFNYEVETKRGVMELSEFSLFPSFIEVAKTFAGNSLTLLK